MINLSKPLIEEEEKRAVLEVLESGKLAQGDTVEKFEEEFAKYCGVKYAITTSSGTTSLYSTLLALGIGPKDEVITTPFTFIATSNAILYTGAKPVFVDIEKDSFNIDPNLIEEAITPNTKAILIVHLYGLPVNIKKISKIAKRHNLFLIEDACQAHGAEVLGKKVGGFGIAGCFSFYPTKNMTTGEGGIVTTNNSSLANMIKLVRNHGMKKRYQYKSLGFNFRMTNIHAAIGLVQLKKLDKFNLQRIKHANFLSEKLSYLVICPKIPEGTKHVFHQYTVRISKNRDRVQKDLFESGVECGIYYPKPIYKYKHYRHFDQKNKSFEETEKATREVLSLPVHPSLTPYQLNIITNNLKNILNK